MLQESSLTSRCCSKGCKSSISLEYSSQIVYIFCTHVLDSLKNLKWWYKYQPNPSPNQSDINSPYSQGNIFGSLLLPTSVWLQLCPTVSRTSWQVCQMWHKPGRRHALLWQQLWGLAGYPRYFRFLYSDTSLLCMGNRIECLMDELCSKLN